MKHLTKRTIAYLIDCVVCYSGIMLIIQWALLSNIREYIGITDVWFENSWNMELYVLISISFPVWLYFTLFDSNRAKGTIGKRLMKLSVQNMENQRIGPSKSLLRTFLKLAPWEISHIGIVFPIPIYFEDEPSIRLLTIVGIVLFFTYMISILISSENQSIYDKLLRVKVIDQANRTLQTKAF